MNSSATDTGPWASQPSSGALSDRRFYIRLGAVTLLAGLIYLIWQVIEPVWHPVAWALLLGTFLTPLNRRITARLDGRVGLASLVTVFLTTVFFVLPVAFLVAELAAQASHLHGRLEGWLPGLRNGLSPDLPGLPALERLLDGFAARVDISATQVHSWLVAGLKALSERLAGSSGVVLKGALGTVVNFVLMIFALFFVLRDGPQLAHQIESLLPIEKRRRTILWKHLAEVTRAVFLGIGAAVLVHGVLMGIGFWIAGMPSALLLAMLAALLAVIPLVGSAIVWIPAVLFLTSQGQEGQAIFLAAWSVLLVGTVDHVLRPMLISGHAKVPPLPVFLGAIGGLHAFGFIGLFIGPIALGMLVALFRYEMELHAARPSVP